MKYKPTKRPKPLLLVRKYCEAYLQHVSTPETEKDTIAREEISSSTNLCRLKLPVNEIFVGKTKSEH